MPGIEGVLFDLDGILIDTEPIWERVRRTFAERHGGRWTADLQTRMMGARTADWSRALSEATGGQMTTEAAAATVIEDLAASYRQHLPVIEGAPAAVRALSRRFRLGLVSGSPPSLIALTLQLMDVAGCVEVAMSADDVERGKPAPDPYLELARRMRLDPHVCVAVEDSGNGIRSASAAGARLVAIPRGDLRPDAETLGLADAVLGSIIELTPELVAGLGV
ncbi:MAG TPA: HAD family phosphatase [Candidatus Limnocylindrales bacterium]|nr:HAD family phosphatase [Candidatus Limnocylindrales bacterium]